MLLSTRGKCKETRVGKKHRKAEHISQSYSFSMLAGSVDFQWVAGYIWYLRQDKKLIKKVRVDKPVGAIIHTYMEI
jgi:hypothetical protein